MKQLILGLLLVLTAVSAAGSDLVIGRFSAGDLSGWRERSFRGTTAYDLVTDGGRKVLRARSDHAASGLIKEMTYDPKHYPLLRWSWKVEHSLKGEDILKKSGDDFAARVYVIFPRFFFWRMRAINYVWAHRMPVGSHAPSPYTDNTVLVAVESGDERAGRWVSEERNVYDDYRKLFGEEPPKVGGIAVMTDTDNTGDKVTAWYGDISVSDR